MQRFLITAIIISFSFGLSNVSFAQYFQQDISYEIDAKQDTSSNVLTVKCDISYTNNSNSKLDTIFLHLWANAFSDKLSAFSDQTIRIGDLEFYFADEKEMGGYQDLEVNVRGQNITMYSWNGNTDVVYFLLPKPLDNGETLDIKTSYTLKLPKKMGRMGYTAYDNYLMYWHPTPAVYDMEGWHPMPYLRMGEMYNEVGDYKINFSSPLESIIASVPSQGSSNSEYKYEINDVIDFAIVTSTNKTVFNHKIKTKQGSVIDIDVMTRYPKRDSTAILYLTEALNYFEPLIGEFPYKNLSVMDKGKKSSSGMEYPGLITVSGEDDEAGNFEYYLVHELLHQWFYSALAFNQRDHAWLDEGLTTYYQQRYYKEVKGEDHYTKKATRFMFAGQQPLLQTAARGQACRHYHRPLNTHVHEIDPINYGLNAYEIPARMFAYLSSYLGKRDFDSAMQSFYTNWKGKHPQPSDLRNSLEKISKKNLEWFFNDLIKKDWSYDYAVNKIEENSIQIEHKSGSSPPYKISLKNKDDNTKEIWVEGHEGIRNIDIPSGFDMAIIDEETLSMDINRGNNCINIGRPIKFVPGLKLDDGRYREVYFLPTLSYNTSDGGQFGLALYNSTFPGKRLKWALSPAYALGSGQPVGEGWVSYDHYIKDGRFRKLQFKLNAKSFSFQNIENFDRQLRYIRLSPHISLHFQHNPQKSVYSKAYFKPIFLNEEVLRVNDEEVSTATRNSTIFRLGYEYYNFWNLGPSEFLAFLEYQPYTNELEEKHHYLKLNASYSKSFFYAPKRSVDFRVWGSYFISNSQRESTSYDPFFTRGSSALIYQGFNDYAYDSYFFNRGNQNVRLDNQIGYEGGGFKTPFGSQYDIGQTNDLAIAVNMKSNLPIRTPAIFPLKLFLDVGYYTAKTNAMAELEGRRVYSGGVMLE